ncbi:MAG: hypothetical protein ABEK29_06650, partial [Bradymonadaceae bacterium]
MTHRPSQRWLLWRVCLSFAVGACSNGDDHSRPRTASKALAADAAPDVPSNEQPEGETTGGAGVETPQAGLFTSNLTVHQIRERQRRAGPSFDVETVEGPPSIATAQNPAQGFVVDFSPVGPDLGPRGRVPGDG